MSRTDTNETRSRLIQSATELILTQGYASVGVQDLCTHAGVKKGSFYHFFPSKRDLVIAALEQHWQTYQKLIKRGLCLHIPGIPPLERISKLFAALHQLYAAKKAAQQALTGCPFGTLTMEVSAHDEALRLALERVFEQWTQVFSQVFRDAISAGELPASANPEAGGRALLAYLEGILLLVKTYNDPDLIQRLSPNRTQLASFAGA
jgi:TetR/AcrR family transcriptional regulator, transcriptional repressor for nem operon